jgi:predicted ester cyclase
MDIHLAERFLARLHSAVNAHDSDGIAALCAHDVLWDDPAAPGPLQGRDAVRSFHRDVMFRAIPDVHVELVAGPYLAGDGTGIAARLRIRGTMTGPLDPPGFAPIDSPIEFETAEFSTLRDGLLSRQVVVLDMLDLARQIGAVPAAGGLGDRIGIWAQHVAAFRARSRS